jgi:hypothetical protein
MVRSYDDNYPLSMHSPLNFTPLLFVCVQVFFGSEISRGFYAR